MNRRFYEYASNGDAREFLGIAKYATVQELEKCARITSNPIIIAYLIGRGVKDSSLYDGQEI